MTPFLILSGTWFFRFIRTLDTIFAKLDSITGPLHLSNFVRQPFYIWHTRHMLPLPFAAVTSSVTIVHPWLWVSLLCERGSVTSGGQNGLSKVFVDVAVIAQSIFLEITYFGGSVPKTFSYTWEDLRVMRGGGVEILIMVVMCGLLVNWSGYFVANSFNQCV